ncbi:unnamed protein product [Blepharisma stoltei]|uniref:PPM-type phosphatase domain-containing protein n=1 Tax=Blepharisma stoltei TaxID=1481888 RepID=A0AAU9JBF7_9CILI|nr:unnamed protein product [Blepharisma stoltei]
MATKVLASHKVKPRTSTFVSKQRYEIGKENTSDKFPTNLIGKNTVNPRHRSSRSHSGVKSIVDSSEDQTSSTLKEENTIKPSNKPSGIFTSFHSKVSTPKGPERKQVKSALHTRASSLVDRPNSLNTLKKKESKGHKRRSSLSINKPQPTVSQFSHISNKGFIPENPGKTNQDNYFEFPNFANHPDLYLFGVCDGHGFYGGEVSGFVKQRLPELLARNPSLYRSPKEALTSSIAQCDEDLNSLEIDVNFSGTTLIVVLLKGTTLFCANVGDSRALIARQMNDTSKTTSSGKHWMSIVLSRDHKPSEKDEHKRILNSGGRVESYQDELGNPLGPARVWLKNQNLPGLGMSRSLGDRVAASVGVISQPEILELDMTPEDKFICLGSDGIFEFIPNEEIVKILVPYWRLQDSEGACKAIAKEAHDRWCQEEEVIDDITALCIFLDVTKS